jgi:UDP-N-acetylmuramoylalanine--D-glutamate ligase
MLLNRDDPQVMAPSAPVKGRQIRHNYLTLRRRPTPSTASRRSTAWHGWYAAEADETLKRRKTEDVVLHIQR